MKSVSWRSLDVQLCLCIAIIVLYVACFGTSYAQRVLAVAGIYALLALGYQFIFGHAGALALSQGTFMGVGAYVSGILNVRYGLAFDASLPLSVGLPVLLAVIVAVPVLRLRTHYFALSTLIIGQIILLVAVQWVTMTGGANGIGGVSGLQLLGWRVAAGWPALAVIWVFVALGGLLAYQFGRGSLGQAYAVMRVNDAAAGSIGIDAARLRLVAFLMSAAYAGFAGALYVHVIRVISPDVLELPIMITCLTIVVVGGRTRIAGVLAAAVLVIELPEWFRFLQKYYLIGYGVMLLLVIVAAPDGLVAAFERLRRDRRRIDEAAPIAVLPLARPGEWRCTGDAPLLQIVDLQRRFGGVRALDTVSLEVRPGEILGLIGPNGSGKTTLVNVVSGLYRADAGRILFDGMDITQRLPHQIARGGIARTFQTVALVDDMTALDNVAVARRRRDRSPMQNRGEAMALLEELGAADVASMRCGALAYGSRRRVEIARALAVEPRLLLLDEPAAGLNGAEQVDLARRLRKIAGPACTLLVIEHNIPFLMSLVDRLVCLDYGKVIAEGLPDEVRQDPRVIEAYLGTPAETA